MLIQISVCFLVPSVQPKILPIPAMTNLLREGMRAAISCQILEGDLPVAFRWEKNGQPITSSPYAPSGIITRRMDEYSASLVIEQVTSLHSGNYTCITSNVAGSERYTVPLTVNGQFYIIDVPKPIVFTIRRAISIDEYR